MFKEGDKNLFLQHIQTNTLFIARQILRQKGRRDVTGDS
jgi:hypothetical protein